MPQHEDTKQLQSRGIDDDNLSWVVKSCHFKNFETKGRKSRDHLMNN